MVVSFVTGTTNIPMNIELRRRRLAIVLFLGVVAVLAFTLTLKVTGPQLSWDAKITHS